jgi:hypothetical protein
MFSRQLVAEIQTFNLAYLLLTGSLPITCKINYSPLLGTSLYEESVFERKEEKNRFEQSIGQFLHGNKSRIFRIIFYSVSTVDHRPWTVDCT